MTNKGCRVSRLTFSFDEAFSDGIAEDDDRIAFDGDDHLGVDFDLMFRRCHIRLPQVMHIPGALRLWGSEAVERLPSSLTVGGDLDIRLCGNLTALPAGLRVGGDLLAAWCSQLQELPDGLTVGGSLKLEHCAALLRLPSNAFVGGDLILCERSDISALPSDLFVGGHLEMRSSRRMLHLPPGMVIGGDLDLAHAASLKTVPGTLAIGRSLLLANCQALRDVAAGLVLKGDLDLSNCGSLARLGMAHIGGNLFGWNCRALADIDNGLMVGGSCYLDHCRTLQGIPKGMRVEGDLSLRWCSALRQLPDDLVVGGSLDLTGCINLAELPRGLVVGGSITLAHCLSLNKLPDGLSLSGTLDLTDCPALAMLPSKLSAKQLLLKHTPQLQDVPDDAVLEQGIDHSDPSSSAPPAEPSPFVVGILADFYGNDPMVEITPVNERRFVPVTRDSIATVLRRIGCGLSFMVENTLQQDTGTIPVCLRFHSLEDFEPEAIVRQTPALAALRKAMATDMSLGEEAWRLAEERIAGQVALIREHSLFQRMEGTWRGLHYLIETTADWPAIEIRLCNLSQYAAFRELRMYPNGKWGQSPLFKSIVVEELQTLGGKPFNLLVADYSHDGGTTASQLLRGLSKIAAAAAAPLLMEVLPDIFERESWENGVPKQAEALMATPLLSVFRALRASPDSAFVGLCLPRFRLAIDQAPYSDERGQELADPAPGARCWISPVYAVAAQCCAAYAEDGAATRICVASGREATVSTAESHMYGTRLLTQARLATGDAARLARLGLIVLGENPATLPALGAPASWLRNKVNGPPLMLLGQAFAAGQLFHTLTRWLREIDMEDPNREIALNCVRARLAASTLDPINGPGRAGFSDVFMQGFDGTDWEGYGEAPIGVCIDPLDEAWRDVRPSPSLFLRAEVRSLLSGMHVLVEAKFVPRLQVNATQHLRFMSTS